jgi:hypothetical protein
VVTIHLPLRAVPGSIVLHPQVPIIYRARLPVTQSAHNLRKPAPASQERHLRPKGFARQSGFRSDNLSAAFFTNNREC